MRPCKADGRTHSSAVSLNVHTHTHTKKRKLETAGGLQLVTKQKQTLNKVPLKFYKVPVPHQGSLPCLQLAAQQSDS